ncbi:hypothetical protein SAMN04487996_104231 [Dyadobacter soli]|uniref:Uncharacterized protein n=1 Tax=Dyadobacter soli TaxID=659014 RepID=A0A1G7BKK6_9BACT|nr:hypothetical protein [Dyadobacter soli]SDE27513.1 hypothetical protein SAMN04487996_104231 [Dyadobacter soli]
MAKYTGQEGQLISAREAKLFTTNHQNVKELIEKDGKNYVEAEFFGLETFNKLLKGCGGKPIGFRIYYGLREENHDEDEPIVTSGGKGRPTPRLVIVPVDADGQELSGLTTIGGHKDMPSDGQAMANGPICPRRC